MDCLFQLGGTKFPITPSALSAVVKRQRLMMFSINLQVFVTLGSLQVSVLLSQVASLLLAYLFLLWG